MAKELISAEEKVTETGRKRAEKARAKKAAR